MTESRLSFSFVSLGALPGYARIIGQKAPGRRVVWPRRTKEWQFEHGESRWRRLPGYLPANSVTPETLIELRGCFINSRGTVLSPEGEVLHGFSAGLGPERKRVMSEPVFAESLDGSWVHGIHNDQHFGHWLLHRLPRIFSALNHSPGLPVITSTSPWTADSLLDSVGAPSRQVTALDWDTPERFHQVDCLIVANDPAPDRAAKVVDWPRLATMASAIRRWASDHSSQGGYEQVYLTRGEGSGIRPGCQNREVIEEAMSRAGIPVIRPERLNFADQVLMAARSREILAEYGSAALLSLFSLELHRLTLFSPFDNYRLERGVARGGPWVRAMTIARGTRFRFASVVGSGRPRDWLADADKVRRVAEAL